MPKTAKEQHGDEVNDKSQFGKFMTNINKKYGKGLFSGAVSAAKKREAAIKKAGERKR